MCPDTPQNKHGDINPFSGKCFGFESSISGKIDVWKRELAHDVDKDYLLDGICNGFRITDIKSSADVKTVESSNHPSALKYHQLVENELLQQIEMGHYILSEMPAKIISPIASCYIKR